jgi:Flp pilus assembly protein TadG
MKTSRRNRQRGQGMVEFVLVSIPLIFILISIFEIARGMWIYHTIQYGVQQGARYLVVHGETCAKASTTCSVTVGDVAQVIKANSTGMNPGDFQVTLKSQSSTLNCQPLSSCLSNGGQWPPAGESHPGFRIAVTGTFPFRSPLCMFWPGTKPVGPLAVNLGATATEEIRF